MFVASLILKFLIVEFHYFLMSTREIKTPIYRILGNFMVIKIIKIKIMATTSLLIILL